MKKVTKQQLLVAIQNLMNHHDWASFSIEVVVGGVIRRFVRKVLGGKRGRRKFKFPGREVEERTSKTRTKGGEMKRKRDEEEDHMSKDEALLLSFPPPTSPGWIIRSS